MPEDGTFDVGEVRLAVGHHVVVSDRCGDLRAGGRRPQREPTAEAEADRSDAWSLNARLGGEELHGAAHVLLGLVHRERHHLLFCLAGLGGALAAVEVGGEREESLASEAVTDRADVLVKAPPLL